MKNECDLVPSMKKCIDHCDWWMEHDGGDLVCCRSLIRTPKFAETLVSLSIQTENEKVEA